MVWIFLSVALLLFVLHPGFRKVSLIIAGVLLVLGLIIATAGHR